MKNNSLFANVDFADTPNLPTDFQLFQVLQEAFRFISKFAGSLSIWLSTQSDFNLLHKVPADVFGSIPSHSESCAQIKRVASSRQNLAALHFVFGSDNKYAIKAYLTKLASSTLSFFCEEVRVHHGFGLPILSLAAAFIPPFDNKSSKALANSITLESTSDQISGHVNQSHRKDYYHGCATLAASNINWKGDAIEPKTGIKFPTFLEDNFSLTTKVLVGIGSRSMRIIKLKSLKLYAFGLYVHPDSICEKLGSKYASVPVAELKNHSDFFEDLLSAFEKSLRTRLQKMNPDTDYHCLRVFGSYFTQDIALPAGTTIDFRQTANGQLITEIGGRQVGAVHSKDLCRAFFDMYIGDLPVSLQAKEEVAENVAGLIRRC